MSGAREPSMEDILASIKRVIAEEKEIRAAAPPESDAVETVADAPLPVVPMAEVENEDDVLELDELAGDPAPVAAPSPSVSPLIDEDVAAASRAALANLASMAATPPATPTPKSSGNPVEDMVREMLKPLLKQWLDDHLPRIVDDHVKREINRITGR